MSLNKRKWGKGRGVGERNDRMSVSLGKFSRIFFISPPNKSLKTSQSNFPLYCLSILFLSRMKHRSANTVQCGQLQRLCCFLLLEWETFSSSEVTELHFNLFKADIWMQWFLNTRELLGKEAMHPSPYTSVASLTIYRKLTWKARHAPNCLPNFHSKLIVAKQHKHNFSNIEYL